MRKVARNVAGFLRASWDRSVNPVSTVDLIIGAVLTLVGGIMNVDLGVLAVTVVVVVFVIRLLVLTPAAMWAESEARHRETPPTPVTVTVEAGGVANITINGPTDYNTAALTSHDAVAIEPPETSQ